MPGAFGEPFRVLDAFPGVTPIVSGLPFFFIRGAPPGNVGTFIDGVRVPALFHLGAGPSVVHPALMDRVDFYPGGYPARFGRFAGAILAGDVAAPLDHFHGEANVRLFDAGALAETPFGDDDRGHALVAGRYGYPALVLPLFAPDTKLAYWDYQTRESWRLGDHDTIGVFAFGSYDDLEQRDNSASPFKPLLGMEFHRVDFRWDHALPNGGNARVGVTLGLDSSNDQTSGVSDKMAAARLEIVAPIDGHFIVRGGADATFTSYALDDGGDDAGAVLFPPRDDIEGGVWTDVVWRPAPGVEIVPGIRTDLFYSHRLQALPPDLSALTFPAESTIPTIDPRLAVRGALAKGVTSIATFGVAHQRPSFFIPLPGLQVAQLTPTLQSSVQLSEGIELALPGEFTATVTGFAHEYFGLTDVTDSCIQGGDVTNEVHDLCAATPVRGRAYGGELFLRRALTKSITGWVSYTLSRSERQSRQIGSLDTATSWIPSEFDRTHVLSAAGAIDLGGGWRAGARFYFDSGAPYSQTTLGIPVEPYNSLRLPNFWRIDARLEKQWHLSKTTRISFVAEGLNVTANKEAVSIQCVPSRTSPIDTCTPNMIGPVTIPSVGAEVYW